MATFRLSMPTLTYELTGANREAKIQSYTTTNALNVIALDRGGTAVVFPSANVAIKAAELSDGGLYIVGGDRIAAEITLIFGTKLDNDQLDETITEIPLTIGKFNRNECQSLNAVLKATAPIYMFIKANSIINISDFNVQDDWVGQEITPMLELEIETDHLLSTDGEVVF